ncbi:MAG: hypothetical protein AAGF94_14750 [Pseudomonadota bacterium]
MESEIGQSINTILPALFGFLGVLVGVLGSHWTQISLHHLKEKPRLAVEGKQIEILKKMLNKDNMPFVKDSDKTKRVTWRKFEDLKNVIGADEETARRLLIQAGARRIASANDKWALLKDKKIEDAFADKLAAEEQEE